MTTVLFGGKIYICSHVYKITQFFSLVKFNWKRVKRGYRSDLFIWSGEFFRERSVFLLMIKWLYVATQSPFLRIDSSSRTSLPLFGTGCMVGKQKSLMIFSSSTLYDPSIRVVFFFYSTSLPFPWAIFFFAFFFFYSIQIFLLNWSLVLMFFQCNIDKTNVL